MNIGKIIEGYLARAKEQLAETEQPVCDDSHCDCQEVEREYDVVPPGQERHLSWSEVKAMRERAHQSSFQEYVQREVEAQVERQNERRRQEIREAIDQYLRESPSSSWGQFFTITDEERRAQCVDYIFKVFEGVDRILNEAL